MLLQMLAEEIAEGVVFLVHGKVRGIGHACREVPGQILCCSDSPTNLGFQQSVKMVHTGEHLLRDFLLAITEEKQLEPASILA